MVDALAQEESTEAELSAANIAILANTEAMFDKTSTFEKGDRSEEAEGAWVPPRSPWEPLTLIGLIGVAVVVVVVAILLTRAFYPS